MTGTHDLDRQLRLMLEAAAPRREPESLFASVMSATRTARQRPGLLVELQRGGVGTAPESRSMLLRALPAALLLAVLLGVLALVGSRVIQPPSPDAPRLAVGYDDGLVIAGSDGGDPRRVRDDGSYAALAWAPGAGHLAALYSPLTAPGEPTILRILEPDGTLVGEVSDVRAFQWLSPIEIATQSPEGSDSQRRVRVVGPDGSPVRDLGSSLASDVVFGHAGAGFVSVDEGAGRPGEASDGSARILLHDPDGTVERELVRIAYGRLSLPAWDTADRELAYLEAATMGSSLDCLTCGASLKVTPSTGGPARTLTDKVGPYERPQWEPNGSGILFTRWVDSQWDLWVAGADGSGLKRLTDDPAEERDPTWSPLGDRILFTVPNGQAGEVWSIAPDGSDARRLATGAVTTAEWEPRDVAIGPATLRRAPGPATAAPAQASATPAATAPPPVRPGEPWLVFASGVSAARDGIFVMREDGSGRQPVAQDVPGSHKHPDWSPDGLRIALVSEVDDSIWVAHVDGSPSERVVTCPSGCDYPAWSPDGSRLAFTEYEQDPSLTGPSASSIRLIDLATGEIASVVREERPLLVDVARWSHDGTHLVVGVDQLGPASEETGAAIAIVPSAGGALRYLTDFDAFAYHPDWSWVTDTIVYGMDVRAFKVPQEPDEEARDLFTIRPDGSGRVQVTRMSVGGRLAHASWAPDGTRIIAIDEVARDAVFVDAATGTVTAIPGSGLTHPRLRPVSP